MPLRLYNTLTGKVEDFHPLDGNRVRMYACGPTVYDYGHIGNFRTFIAIDLLYRFLRQSGYEVRYVMNITDVDDKIIRNAARDGVSVQQYTAKFQQAFLEDSATLNIQQPVLVRATEHIGEMADFIGELVKKGFAYRTEDGSYYFRIAKFPEYGKLSKKDFAGMTTARASMWTSTTRTMPATSRCGRRPSRARLRGIRRLARAGRGGTSSAR